MVREPAGWRESAPDDETGSAALRFLAPAGLRPRLLIAGSLFVASLVLYISTLAPSVVALFDDSLEFQLVVYQLGIAHPTGYPLYTLLGKLFTFLPLGNIAYRVNLMSAVFGAATVALLYGLILALTAPGSLSELVSQKGGSASPPPAAAPVSWQSHLGAAVGAVLLAIGPVFWQQATVAEVYTLNAFFVALLLLVALWPLRGSEEKKQRLFWLAFLAGLSLTHHRTMLLLLPALAVYLIWVNGAGFFKRLGLKTSLLILVLGLMPLLLYLYLPLRGHAGSLDGTYNNTWTGFWRHVSGGGYSLFIFDNPFDQNRPAGFYWQLMQTQFVTFFPGLFGILYLVWTKQPKKLLLTGLAFVTYFSFNIFYRVSDIEVFFIPVFLIWASWSGAGAAFLLHWASTAGSRGRIAITGLLLALFAFTILRLGQSAWPDLSHRYTWKTHDYGLDILQHAASGRSALVGILGEVTLVKYFQQTENLRPELETVAADGQVERLAAVERLLKEGKTVYLTRELAGAPEKWSLYAVGPLIRVELEPVTELPRVSNPVERSVTPAIKLLGYNTSRPSHTGAGPAPLRLTLFWQAQADLDKELKVSARLLDATGEAAAVVDKVPVHFAYPVTAWRQGEIVSDVYDLELPAGLQPGLYTPLLIWYDPAQNAAEVARVELPSLQLEP